TNIDTGGAMPAMVFVRGVVGQFERREDRAEKEPRAILARDQIGVLSLPAKAGLLSQRLFHDRRRIDEHLDVAAAIFHEPARDFFQPRLDNFVIVLAAGIDGNCAALAPLEDRERIFLIGPVIESEYDDGANLAPQRARIAAPVGARLEPAHLAVGALGEESLEMLFRLGD